MEAQYSIAPQLQTLDIRVSLLTLHSTVRMLPKACLDWGALATAT